MPVSNQSAPGFLVGRVAHLLRGRVAYLIKERGFAISAEECAVLSAVVESNRPLRVGELAQLVARDPTTLKRQLDGLAKCDLIARTSDESDGRVVMVVSTEAGRQTIAELASPFEALCEQTLADISTDEVQVVQRALKLMMRNLCEDIADAAPSHVEYQQS